MSVSSYYFLEDDSFDISEDLHEIFSQDSFESCDECESESLSELLHYCSVCSRQLCSECFLSDFDTICYDCIRSDKE